MSGLALLAAALLSPDPRPGVPEMERAMLEMLTCRDTDGITDCVNQPLNVTLHAVRCRGIAHGENGRRIACRVSATVLRDKIREPRGERFDEACIRFERYSDPEFWLAEYVEPDQPCEMR